MEWDSVRYVVFARNSPPSYWGTSPSVLAHDVFLRSCVYHSSLLSHDIWMVPVLFWYTQDGSTSSGWEYGNFMIIFAFFLRSCSSVVFCSLQNQLIRHLEEKTVDNQNALWIIGVYFMYVNARMSSKPWYIEMKAGGPSRPDCADSTAKGIIGVCRVAMVTNLMRIHSRK